MTATFRNPTRKHPGFDSVEETPQGRTFLDTLSTLLGITECIMYSPECRLPDGSHVWECWGNDGNATLYVTYRRDGTDNVTTYLVRHRLVRGAPRGRWELRLVTRRIIPELAEAAGFAAPPPELSKAATKRWWATYRAARGSEFDELSHEFFPEEPWRDAPDTITFTCAVCEATASTSTYLPPGTPVTGFAEGVPNDESTRRIIAEFGGIYALVTELYDVAHAFVAKEAMRLGRGSTLYLLDAKAAPSWCPECSVAYCLGHWCLDRDELHMTCPAGHNRTLA